MATFNIRPHDPANPQTHALIIGVGEYPYVSTGSTPRLAAPALNQLPFARNSALAVARWLAERYDCPAAPLQSIELLLSPAGNVTLTGPGGNQFVSQATMATFDEISAAYNAWFDRCNLNDDNRAIFYFCGHGLESIDQLLLPADFGCVPGNLWAKVVNFSKTRRSLEQCRAMARCCIVDACREWPTSALGVPIDVNSSPGLRTVAIPPPMLNGPRAMPVINATMAGRQAWNDPGTNLAKLSASLLQALDGGGAQRDTNGNYRITTDSLGRGVKGVFEFDYGDAGLGAQMVDISGNFSTNVSLHNLPPAVRPDVRVRVQCDPLNFTPQAEIVLKNLLSQQDYSAAPLANGSCQVCRAHAGFYQLTARVNGAAVMMGKLVMEPVEPPVYEATLVLT